MCLSAICEKLCHLLLLSCTKPNRVSLFRARLLLFHVEFLIFCQRDSFSSKCVTISIYPINSYSTSGVISFYLWWDRIWCERWHQTLTIEFLSLLLRGGGKLRDVLPLQIDICVTRNSVSAQNTQQQGFRSLRLKERRFHFLCSMKIIAKSNSLVHF